MNDEIHVTPPPPAPALAAVKESVPQQNYWQKREAEKAANKTFVDANFTKREHRQEACKTYNEQIKLLVTLASAFIVAPGAILALTSFQLSDRLILGEICFIASVLFGYLAMASVTGTQASGRFDVYRPAIRIFSLLQFIVYLSGLALFIWWLYFDAVKVEVPPPL